MFVKIYICTRCLSRTLDRFSISMRFSSHIHRKSRFSNLLYNLDVSFKTWGVLKLTSKIIDMRFNDLDHQISRTLDLLRSKRIALEGLFS